MDRVKAALIRWIKLCVMSPILWGVLTLPAQSAGSGSSIIRAVLFFLPTCPHCTYIKEEVLPPLISRYGSKLELATVNTATPSGYELFLNACMKYGNPCLSIPMLIVGNAAMTGDQEIPQKFPSLIDKHITAGGIDWPKIAGLSAMLTANSSLAVEAPQRTATAAASPSTTAVFEPVSDNVKAPFMPAPMAASKEGSASEPHKLVGPAAPKPSPIPGTSEHAGTEAAQKGVPSVPVNESSSPDMMQSSSTVRPGSSRIIDLTAGEAEFGVIARIKQDLYGNSLAILVLAGMVMTLLLSPVILKKASAPMIKDTRPR